MQTAIKSKNSFKIRGKVVWVLLTRGQRTCVELSDWLKVARYRWSALKSTNTFYAQGWVDGGMQYMHSFILGSRERHDHKDGNGLNNLRSNLRLATSSQNGQNKRKQAGKFSSSFKGVSWSARKEMWESYTCQSLRKIFIGYFNNEVEAAKAYDEKAKELFGEFARLNFPESKQPACL